MVVKVRDSKFYQVDFPRHSRPDTSMLSSSARPPLDGSIPVLPGFVDFHAEHNPQQPWAVLSAGPELPVDAVPFSEFARATHRVAHRLRPDKSGPEDEVVAVLVNCDSVLYLALIAGMIRAGLVVCLH